MKFALLAVAAVALYLATLVDESSAETVVANRPAGGVQYYDGDDGWDRPVYGGYDGYPPYRRRRRRRHNLVSGLLGALGLSGHRRRRRWDARRGRWVYSRNWDHDSGSRGWDSDESYDGDDYYYY